MKRLIWTLLAVVGMWLSLADGLPLTARSESGLHHTATAGDLAYWHSVLLLADVEQSTSEIVAASFNSSLSTATTVTLSPSQMAFFRTLSPVLGWHCVVSPPQTAVLKNTGGHVLKITGMTISGPFSLMSECGSNLAPGNACTLTVTSRRPTTWLHYITLHGQLNVMDNGAGSPQVVNLSLHVGEIPC